jgi:hypothetical protein
MKLISNDFHENFWDEVSDELFNVTCRKIKNKVSSNELNATLNQVFDYIKENRNENSET